MLEGANVDLQHLTQEASLDRKKCPHGFTFQWQFHSACYYVLPHICHTSVFVLWDLPKVWVDSWVRQWCLDCHGGLYKWLQRRLIVSTESLPRSNTNFSSISSMSTTSGPIFSCWNLILRCSILIRSRCNEFSSFSSKRMNSGIYVLGQLDDSSS